MSIIYKCCCKTKDDYGVFFCVLPLALSAIILSLLLLWWATWGIYASVTYPYFPDFQSVCSLVGACFKALCGLWALLGIIIKRGRMMHLMVFFIDGLVAIAVIGFIIQWVFWGLALGGVTTPNNVPWVPDSVQIATMVIDSICNIMVVIGGYFVIGLFQSLGKVLDSGGNGWERLNYKELGVDADIEDRDVSNLEDKYTFEDDDGKFSVDQSSGKYSGDKYSGVSNSMMESEIDSRV